MVAKKVERAWSDFAEWCRARRLRALPAHPWTVAAYARWCETRHRYPVVLDRIRAIARMHLLQCAPSPDRHPTVTRTLRTLEARNRARTGRVGLFPVEDAAGGAPKRAAKAKAEPKPKPVRERRRDAGLRSSPKLVRRRPKDV